MKNLRLADNCECCGYYYPLQRKDGLCVYTVCAEHNIIPNDEESTRLRLQKYAWVNKVNIYETPKTHVSLICDNFHRENKNNRAVYFLNMNREN